MSTLGSVAFIPIEFRSNFGQGRYAPSSAAFSQVSASLSGYSRKGENSLHPAGPRKRAASRTLTPRKFVRVGIATTVRS